MSQSGVLNFAIMPFPPGTVVETLTGNSGGAVGPSAGNNINVVGDGVTATVVGVPGTNTLTITALGATVETVPYKGIVFADSPYTALATDYYIGADVTGGAITVRLPNAPATGRVFVVKDKAGLAAGANITVTTVGGIVLIDGAATFVMNTAYESAMVIFNGSAYEVF
jgi:hypothetical protein